MLTNTQRFILKILTEHGRMTRLKLLQRLFVIDATIMSFGLDQALRNFDDYVVTEKENDKVYYRLRK